MSFTKLVSGRALYTDGKLIWVATGLIWGTIDFEGNDVGQKITVGSRYERLLGKFRLSRQLLRVGIHHLLPLKGGNILVTLKKRTLILSPAGDILHTFSGYRGNKPGHRGICVTPDGTIFFGEYTLNQKRDHDTKLFRSIDDGATFEPVLTFSKEEVRHIHFVQWDQFEHCLWLGTGDKDSECKLLRSDDNGITWVVVGGGNQRWRAVSVSCTQEALYWGTDAGSVPDRNYLVRMDRATRALETITELEGPCHGNGVLADGTVFLSTGVEGGENEKDRYARLYMVEGGAIIESLRLQKDILPLIVQYGVMRFPGGMENSLRPLFTTYGLRKLGEAVILQDSKRE